MLAVAVVGVQAGRNRALSEAANHSYWIPAVALAAVLVLAVIYWKKLRDEERAANRGQMLVLFAVSTSVLAMVAALAVDAGYMFYSKATLQNAADAGSLAAIHTMVDLRGEEDDEEDIRDAAREEAESIAALNHPGARYEVKFGVMEDGEFEERDEDTEATAVQITVHRDSEAPDGALDTFFAHLGGLESIEISASASSASLTEITAALPEANLRPFAVHENEVAGWEPGQDVQIQLPKPGGGNGNGKGKGKGKGKGGGGNGNSGGSVTPGNWGWLDLDGRPGKGVAEQRPWILEGYHGTIELDETGDDGRRCTYIEGSPGVRRALNNTGANTVFRVVGFLSMNFEDIVPGERGSDILLGTFNEIRSVHHFKMGDGGSPHGNLRRVCIMQ
jgi:uncharacterized membrane protein YgcG